MFLKDLAKTKKSKQYSLENKLKLLEANLNCDINSSEYINCKNQLEEIYDDSAEGIKVNTSGMKRVRNKLQVVGPLNAGGPLNACFQFFSF